MKIGVGDGEVATLPVLVMVSSHSRFITAMMLSSSTTGDLLGMWRLLSYQLGAVPRTLLGDNEAGIGRGGRLATGVAGFCALVAGHAQVLIAELTQAGTVGQRQEREQAN